MTLRVEVFYNLDGGSASPSGNRLRRRAILPRKCALYLLGDASSISKLPKRNIIKKQRKTIR